MWRGIVETSWRSTGLGVGSPVRTTEIFTDLIEGAGHLSVVAPETETVAQWNLDVCLLLAGSC
jgi:hypothetical protein